MTNGHPVQRAAAMAARLPLGLRWGLVGASLGLVFWLALAPSPSAPSVSQIDKVQHALAFCALTLAYGLMFPRQRGAVLIGVIGLGVLIEVLQGAMPYGRSADIRDVVADLVGVAAGLMLLRLLTGPAGRTT